MRALSVHAICEASLNQIFLFCSYPSACRPSPLLRHRLSAAWLRALPTLWLPGSLLGEKSKGVLLLRRRGTMRLRRREVRLQVLRPR